MTIRTIFEFRDSKEEERPRFTVDARTYSEAINRVIEATNHEKRVLLLMDYSMYQVPSPATASSTSCGCHEA